MEEPREICKYRDMRHIVLSAYPWHKARAMPRPGIKMCVRVLYKIPEAYSELLTEW